METKNDKLEALKNRLESLRLRSLGYAKFDHVDRFNETRAEMDAVRAEIAALEAGR